MSEQATLLRANRADIETFTAYLFAYADPEGFVSMRAFAEHDRSKPPLFIEAVRVGDPRLVDRIVAFAEKVANHPIPAVFCMPPCIFRTADNAREDNVHEVLVLSTENDQRPRKACADLASILRVKPTLTVASGGTWSDPETGEIEDRGHVYTRLQEPARDTDDQAAAKECRALMAAITDADPSGVSVVHPMRVPGSWHRKGEPKLATIIDGNGSSEIGVADALERLKEAYAANSPTGRMNGAAHSQDDSTSRAPLDVAEALSAMVFRGDGSGTLNGTQLRCTASLLRTGMSVDLVVDEVLTATRRCHARAVAAGNPKTANWDWAEEERGIRAMCYRQINKNKELADLLPDDLRQKWAEVETAGGVPFISRNPYRFFVRAAVGKSESESDDSRIDGGPQEAPKAPRRSRTVMQPFKGFDWATFPSRQWLYANHYQRKTASATVAPGGTGKTTLGMVDAVALATCRNLLGEQPTERCRVWLHNGEDPIEEMDRRIGAICHYYGIPMAELEGWLFRSSGAEVPLRVANGFSDLKLDAPLIALIKDEIRANQIDVVILDPLVTLHSTAESDNGKMDQVMRVFTGIATEMECAIDVSHHTRKLAAGVFEHTAEDSRGAVAIRDAVRAMRVLNIMSATEAANLGIPESDRQSYVRVDRGKGNSLPPAKVATWRKFENVPVPNGDRVGVLTAWEKPLEEGAATKAATESVFLLLLDQYTLSGRTVSAARNAASYAPRVFAAEDEAIAAKCTVKGLEGAMKRLFKNGCIRAGDGGQSGAIVRVTKPIADTAA
jgi:hypothetical protein